MAAPTYRVQVFDYLNITEFGIGALIAEFDRPHAIGYGRYINSVPEAFFSLHQDDPKIAALRDKGGIAHVRIWRDASLVWTGWVGLERDANGNDAIFYCYGYEADLFWLLTDWQQTWTTQTVGTIVSNLWQRAKTDISNTRLRFVATGTIEEPPTVAGGATPITLPEYKAFYKRILFALQEMAAVGSSDTGNSTMFEITHTTTPTFNFWKDKGSSLASTVRWEWGDGRVQSFREYGMPVYRRNHVEAVGQQPRDLILRKTARDDADALVRGRFMEPLFLSWVRDESELTRVLNRRAALAKREEVNLTLGFYPGAEEPPGTASGRFYLADTVPVKIVRGVTNVNREQQIAGYMVAVLNGQEKMNVMLQDPIA